MTECFAGNSGDKSVVSKLMELMQLASLLRKEKAYTIPENNKGKK